jgi:predicted P-loop ATPase
MGSEMSALSADWTPQPITNSAESATGWKAQLLVGKRGGILGNIANALTALRSAAEWQGVLHFNESSLATVAKARPPFERAPANVPFCWSDEHDVLTAAWLQHQGIPVNKEIAGQAVEVVAREHSFHPIRDYLSGLVWDKTPRINEWLTLYLGVDSSEYAQAVGSKWLIGAVARIFKPGCKNDTCLVLEGPQGLLKSTALRTIAEPWFTDEIADLGTKDAALQVRGVWIIELAELEAMGRPEASRTKAFMSRSTDRYRPPYGRHVIEVPRESVFAGTVNHDTYLKDETGGRRFWPIRCENIRVDDLRRDRDQLWAEAVARFRARESWWIDSSQLSAIAAEEQQQRYDEDPWQPLIKVWIQGFEHASVEQVLLNCLEKQPRDWTQGDKARVARCLRAIGWTRKRAPKDDRGHREWRYHPGPSLRNGPI